MNEGNYLRDTDPTVWVFDDLRDPLCGSKADIERYLGAQHQHPGLAVELGARAMSVESRGGQTSIDYRFNRGDQVKLTATIDATQLCRHRRGYVGSDGSKILNASWRIKAGQPKPAPERAVVDLGLETELDHDVAAVLAIKQELAARLSQVV